MNKEETIQLAVNKEYSLTENFFAAVKHFIIVKNRKPTLILVSMNVYDDYQRELHHLNYINHLSMGVGEPQLKYNDFFIYRSFDVKDNFIIIT